MSEIWHAERMYIQVENGIFVAQAFSLEDATAIVREHNAHAALLAACKAALDTWGNEAMYPLTTAKVKDAIALAEVTA